MREERSMFRERPIVPDEPVAPDGPPATDRGKEQPPEVLGNGDANARDFQALRSLLVGPERDRLVELTERVDGLELTPSALAEHLPDAIALRTSHDQSLGRALAPTVETALRESIRRNPREIAAAIFPVLGPAIRKAIAETMAALVRSINGAVEHSLSIDGIKWRLEAWRTGVPYPQIVIKHALVYRVEQVFLIHAETGLLLAHVAAQDLKVPDADLISSMLSAIQDFVRDSFRPGEGATLRAFTVGEHTVQVEAGPRALLAAVIRGQAPESVTLRLQNTLEILHFEFASQLAEYQGDATPFEPARPLLEECLETVLSTDLRREGTGRVWLRWAVPLATVVLLIGGLWLQSQLRWRRAVRALEGEPGYFIAHASRGWSEWRFAGLKDPSARDAKTVLAAAGLAPSSLVEHWESYLSLAPALVLERARRVLALPSSATVALRADTLVVAGDAPIEWLAQAHAAALPAGAVATDFSKVNARLSPRLDSLKRAIEGGRVLFEAGASELSAGADSRLRATAAAFRQLADDVTALGAFPGLALVGRTDPSGSDETNQTLAQWRVDRVTERLAALGVERSYVSGRPVATTSPLAESDPAQRARINRSVSFEVTIQTGPRSPKPIRGSQ